jgi:CRISPR-associated endonuclease Csn1
MELDERREPRAIRLAGVRCFDSGVGSEQEIERGKDESANAKRRQARQQRRQLWRRSRRQAKLFRVLQHAGLLPAGESRLPEQRHQVLLQLDAELASQDAAAGDRVAAHLLPYRLRAKSLDEPLPPHALGRTLYHLGQRRGFLSNKKAAKADEDKGVVYAGITELEKAMAEAKARTLGEYFASLDPEERRIRGRWTARRMYAQEFDAIWAAQAPHHAACTEELRRNVHRVIFHQRPLKSQKGLIGKCELEPGHRRAPMASLAAQRFRYWQKINDLEVRAPDNEILELTPEQRHLLADALETQAEMTFAGVLRTLGLKKPKGAEQNYQVNLAAGGETKLKGNRTAAKLLEALGDRWRGMREDERDHLVEEILAFEKEDALARRLVKAWGMDESTACNVAGIDFEPGYCGLSIRAIRKVLPLMQQGTRFATARKKAYEDRTLDRQIYELLPPVARAAPQLRNPVVSRALTELRKVVNAMVRKYGRPALVRLEMARDMKRGRKKREEAWKAMRQNEDRRQDAKARILKEAGIQAPRPGDILKVRLAEECNWQCPYTGRQIAMSALVGPTSQFDIEHILPFPRSLDDSFTNKTLCYHEENRNVKKNRTPFEAYEGNAQCWEEILQRVRRFRGPAARTKLSRFLMEAIPEDFVSRQLNDTRYISRLAGDYLGMLFGGQVDANGCRRVQVSTGAVTAYIRDEFDLNSILGEGGEKTRTDHRHHAVDAVAIALAGPGTVAQLSLAAQQADEQGRRRFVRLLPPWEGFAEQARHAIGAINVSYRVDRRVSGALHDATNYSEPQHATGSKPQRQVHHVRKLLEKMSAGEIEAIVDDCVRNAVQKHVARFDGDLKKAFADANQFPYLRAADGRLIPIRKARIRKPLSALPLGRPPHVRYVAPGSNHHMEIVAVLDAQGRDKKWEGRIVTLYEAAQRAARGEDVVCRNHGAGRDFRFSLSGNEYVEMDDKAGNRCLYRIVVITEKEIEFRLQTDARPDTLLRQKEHSGGRVRRSLGGLLDAHARKVAVDPLGNVFPAND